MSLIERARAMQPSLVEMRRDLHRHPELGFQEERTARIAADAVEALGFRVRRGVGITGVVAELGNGAGPTVALRADMDALPIQEEAGVEYASRSPGVMHACGHDAHTTGLVGAAHLLAEELALGTLPPGVVRLIFQPSEEGTDEEGKSGAMRMIADGAMGGVDAVVGLHVSPERPAGKIFVCSGAFMAGAEELRVTVRGRSSHAARPELGVDALLLAAQGLVAAKAAANEALDPGESGVVSFGKLEAGTAGNIIADRAILYGTLRYFDRDVRARLVAAVTEGFESLEASGAGVTVDVGPGFPPLLNDEAVTRCVSEALGELLGDAAVAGCEPEMTAEDFAYLAREAPSVFFWLGASLPDARELHHPRFDIDESVLPVGAAALAHSAITLLRTLQPGT
ncbi:MAG: M20 family metallopeptidase [Gemmatimonadota bacterium]|nr:MAG: M20 family metallopeptidase [Gemmatimonadota bacterium]